MTHTDIINKWPSLTEFAADLAVEYGTAKAMRRRGSIPAKYWLLVVTKATERGLAGVSHEALTIGAAAPAATEAA